MNNLEIDEKKLLELKGLLEESFSMLIVTFIQDIGEQLIKLENYVQQEKYSELSKIAHSMKGSSGNMGAKYLYSLVLELEGSCKKEELESAKKTVYLIRQHYPTLKVILEKLIS